MTQARRCLAIAWALWLAAPAQALAHEFWIEPSTFSPTSGQHVAVRLRVGEAFAGSPVPRSTGRIVRFDFVHQTVSPIPGREGADPAGIVHFEGTAAGVLVYQSKSSRIELAAARFEDYLEAEGLERIVEERAKRGESEAAGREAYVRCAKALLHPGSQPRGHHAADAPDRALGLPLELVAEADPATLEPDAKLPLRLLFRGQGVEGVLVRAWQRGSSAPPVAARTKQDGRLELRLGNSGSWLVSAVHMTRAELGGDVDWQSWWASLTFRRGDPGGAAANAEFRGASARKTRGAPPSPVPLPAN